MTTLPRIKITLTESELEAFKKKVKASGLTQNNYLRRKLRLPAMKHGGKREKDVKTKAHHE